MDIALEKKDELNAKIKIKIVEKDYEKQIKEELKKIAKKTAMKGFRPGKVPMGLIQKQYGDSVLAEELNKKVSESLSKFISDEKINIIGEPLPTKEEENKKTSIADKEFEFVFDIGIAPEFELNVSKEDKVIEYEIIVDKELIDERVDYFKNTYSEELIVDTITNDKQIIKVDFSQLNDKKEVDKDDQNLITTKNTIFSLMSIKNEEKKKEINGKKIGDKIKIDVKKTFENDIEISSMLRIEKDAILDEFWFEVEILEVKDFKPAEMNQVLFDKVFGENIVKTEEEFNEKLKKNISKELKYQAGYKLKLDLKKFYEKKLKLNLPDEFLKKLLEVKQTDKSKTKEISDKDFKQVKENLNWSLILEKFKNNYEIKVEDEEVRTRAKQMAQQQAYQYGIPNLQLEQLEELTNQIMKNSNQVNQIYEHILEDKVIKKVKPDITITKKAITHKKLKEMLDSK